MPEYRLNDDPAPNAFPVELDTRAQDRRAFFRSAFGAAAVAAVGVGGVTVASRAFADTTSDVDALNFALTLKYLQAQFYNFAAFGTGLSSSQISGTGTAGAATGARQASFTDPIVAQFAAEMATETAAHVNWLRGELGAGAVAQPTIDLGTAATGAFSKIMNAAGIVGAGASFDPYASDGNFLLAAFLFEDVAVTALKGIAYAITDKTHLEAGAGIMGTDAHHAAMIRATLYAKGATNATLRTQADAISDIRDRLDGTSDDDQGISPSTVNGNLVSNITPTAADGTVFGRIAGGVLNILYLNSASVTKGGFFPDGINGNITASSQN